MPNLYIDLNAFRRRHANDAELDAADQTEILAVLEGASRIVDGVGNRHFYAEELTNYYDGRGQKELWLPTMPPGGDLLSVTTLKVDEDGDGTYEVELTELTDFWLWPDNATPKLRVDINPQSAQLSRFPSGRRRVEIVGINGYSNVTENTGDTVQDNPLSASATLITVTAAGSKFSIGQTLLLESEQVWISDISSSGLTVTRGVNGTTAASHVQGTVINRYVYDPKVVKATMAQAGDDWMRRNTAYARVESPSFGSFSTIPRGVHPDVWTAIVGGRLRVPVVA